MNNLKEIHPVHLSNEHLGKVDELIDTWGGRILLIGATSENDSTTSVKVEKLYEIFGNETKLPYDDSSFDNLLCIDSLSRVPNPYTLVKDIYRVLVDGAHIYIEVPFMTPYTTGKDDLYRFTPRGLETLFSKFTITDIGVLNGPGSTMHWISRIYSSLRFDRYGTVDTLHTLAGDTNYMEAYSIFGMEYEHYKRTDEVLGNREHASSIACSLYLLGSK